jgi:Protein of unknown function (DUF2490)
MTSSGLATVVMTILLGSTAMPILAQSVQVEPEMDAHLKLTSFMRVYLQAKDDRDGGTSDQFSIGPSLQLYFKPLLALKKIAALDLDDTKPRLVVLEAGYRHITMPNAPPTNRLQPVLTFNFPMGAEFSMSERNRADLGWKDGAFTWRYRNKLTLEHTFAVHSYHLFPYVAAEPYYEDQYRKWSTTALFAGCRFSAGKHLQINTYYEHENNTGKQPNQEQNNIGIVLNVFCHWQTDKE